MRTTDTSPLAEIALGEDRARQFKRDVSRSDALAAEMAAFVNSEGGTIFLGVADDGSTPGLSSDELRRLNQLIDTTAHHCARGWTSGDRAHQPQGDRQAVFR
ncbi:MAG: ATP-binding protein [Myxococcales bacterium]|jgi:ATP-dependent DNA helicase RecG|nr:ATP-binding protein [Myxococcales bacterium]